MSTNQAHDTERVARAYFDAWTTRDTKSVRSLLAEDFRFMAGDMTVEGRDRFLDAGAFPREATTSMVAEAYQGEVGFQMYDATKGGRSVRIVEQLLVRNGRVASSAFVADMASFMGLMSE